MMIACAEKKGKQQFSVRSCFSRLFFFSLQRLLPGCLGTTTVSSGTAQGSLFLQTSPSPIGAGTIDFLLPDDNDIITSIGGVGFLSLFVRFLKGTRIAPDDDFSSPPPPSSLRHQINDDPVSLYLDPLPSEQRRGRNK